MTSKYFIKIAFVIVFYLMQDFSSIAEPKQKPNILIIMTDQQFADVMSCVMGNEYINTPNMDLLAENGTRFTKAYSPNPLSMPMRTSMLTGMFPHETGVLINYDEIKVDLSKNIFLGKIFKDAGYETAYFGKWHIAFDQSQKTIHGFNEVNAECDLDPIPAAEFIRQKHERPFLAIASFLSPHEICEWSRKQELPGDPLIKDIPSLEKLPPLKTNFNPPENETDIMTFMRKSYQAHILFPVGNYTDYEWRRLAWGYYRLVERADKFVGVIMNALKESGQEKNTLVVFLSDHGDCCGSHHWNQKTVFYDESARVPLIIMWKDKTYKGTSEVLVNTGTDIIPTICDFAGIDIPSGLPGKSLMAPATGTTPKWKREFVVSENHMVQCEPVDGKSYHPYGRMVRSPQYKYCIYSEGKNRESLIDMQFDPLEMVNQAKNPVYKKVLEQHRQYLKEHAEQYNDKVALQMLDRLRIDK